MAKSTNKIAIRECTSFEELAKCVQLQRDVFGLPELEISPVRHLVVTRNAGGFTLGAYIEDELVGFVLSVPAYLRGKRAFYSHMTAVRSSHQSFGIGARLKWGQRERSLAEGVNLIKWTFEPVKARNAYFNLEKLGAVVREYEENYYGVDYVSLPGTEEAIGLTSDRLFAEWELESKKVTALAAGQTYLESRKVAASIAVPDDWDRLLSTDVHDALSEQLRVRSEFQNAIRRGLICRGFERHETRPRFLLFED